MLGTAQEKFISFSGLEAALTVAPEKPVEIQDLVVGIDIVPPDSSGTFSGSGTLITKDGFVLTAFHVVESYITFVQSLLRAVKNVELFRDMLGKANDDARVRIGGRSYPLEGIFLGSGKTDFVVVKANIPGDPVPTGISLVSDVYLGQPITAVGTLDRKYPGIIVHIRGVNDSPLYVTTDAPAFPGMSGGAFVTERGKYCGMVTIQHPKTKPDNEILSGGPTARYIQLLLLPLVKQLKERAQARSL